MFFPLIYSLTTGHAVFQYSPFLILRWFKSNESPCAYCFSIFLSKPLHFLLLIKIFKTAIKLLVLWGSNNKISHAATKYIVNCYNMTINQYLLIFRYSLESSLTNESAIYCNYTIWSVKYTWEKKNDKCLSQGKHKRGRRRAGKEDLAWRFNLSVWH